MRGVPALGLVLHSIFMGCLQKRWHCSLIQRYAWPTDLPLTYACVSLVPNVHFLQQLVLPKALRVAVAGSPLCAAAFAE